MADRYPLIVNSVSRKIEELVSGDNLQLTGNGITIGGDLGAGKYLYSDGTTVFWNSPGDVYLTTSQTVTNKVFESCTIDGANNSLSNIPNGALLNSGITVNGTTVDLGGTLTVADNNTTYNVSAEDATSNLEKIIRLTSAGSGAGITDDVKIGVGSPQSVTAGNNALQLEISRTGDTITIAGQAPDTDTVTSLIAPGGSATSGALSFTSSGSATVTMTGSVINIASTDTDTKTKIRAGAGGVYAPADGTVANFTFLQAGATTVTQGTNAGSGDPEITISSLDTITRLKGGTTGTLTSGDLTLVGGSSGNVTVSQSGSTINIDSTDNDTITRLASGSNAVNSGDFKFTASGATSITQSTNAGVTTIEISSVNTDSGAAITASGGLQFASSDISLKNSSNLVGNTLVKWDSGNTQLSNSIIQDDGTTVTIGGDLLVTGTQTILEVATLVVEDNIIELRKGLSLVAADGGIQVNRTSDAQGNISNYQRLEWYEAGQLWRFTDGSVNKNIITDQDTQILENKTLNSPTLTTPVLGAATATSINGLEITTTASAVLTMTDAKTLEVKRDLLFTSDNNAASISVNFRQGGNVAYTNDTLAVFASTTSTQMRGLVSDTTGTDRLVFQNNPNIITGLTTTSTGLTLFNSSATSITAFGAATAINIGAAGGTTTIDQDVKINENLEIGENNNGTITDGDVKVYGQLNAEEKDIWIRGTKSDPMSIGRGAGAVATNTRLGVSCLDNISSGSQNTAVGYKALLTVNSGAGNTAFGNRALNQLGVGDDNIAIGRDALLSATNAEKIIAIGNNAMENNLAGEANVCIGYYAGYGLTGSGNVIIGPSADANSTNATHTPIVPDGDNQLIIGSGTEAWIRGDNTFKVTIGNDLTVDGDALIQGSLTVNGTVTSINSNVIQVDDKNLELAAVVNTTFTAVTVDNTTNITAITPTSNLIPGMVITSTTGGISVPVGTTIVSITGNTAVVSAAVTGSGTATFQAVGPSDTAADGGGVIVKGTTDHSILYDNRTNKYFTCTDNFELAFGKEFVINNQLALSTTTLGSTVVNSSLTSVGVLVGPSGSPALEVDGAAVLGGRVIEKVFSSFASTFTINSNTLNVTTAGANTLLGTTPTTAINTWAFDTADPDGNLLQNGQSITVTVIIDANAAATYGDVCTVDGNSVTNGVQWAGGSPPLATSNTDILSFIVMKDNSGVVRVFGQGNTDFS